MNNELHYAIVETLPESLDGFQSKAPRQLADGRYIIKWAGEDCPCEIEGERNRYQTGIVYWFIEKREWYTHSEMLRVVAAEPAEPHDHT